jgi:hypothetical protein
MIIKKNSLLLIFSILLSIIALDLLSNFMELRPKKWSDDLLTNGWVTWSGADHIDKPHNTQTNGFETRGKVPKNKKKIILLGDSMIETSHKLEEMPENFLEKNLSNFSVISFGSWGWGQDQQLLHLKKYIKSIKPDIVVLWFVSNDLDNNTNEIGFLGIKPTFTIKNNKLIYPSVSMGERTFFYYLHKSYFFRVFDSFKRRIMKKNFFSNDLNKKCNQNLIYDKYEDLAKNLFNKDEYEKSKFIAENKPKPHDGKTIELPNFNIWKKNEIDNVTKNFNKDIDDVFVWNKESISNKEMKEIVLTNFLLKEIEKLTIENNSKFLIFFPLYDYKRFFPFKNEEKYKVCKNGNEFTYANDNVYKKIDLIFQGIKNTYILEENINLRWYDKFDGHPSKETNEYYMKKLSEKIINLNFDK